MSTSSPSFSAAAQRVRSAGSGFTLFTFGGIPIAFCQTVSKTSGSFTSQPSVIQPMDEPYALQILTPMSLGPGTLVLNMWDIWGTTSAGSKIWDRLGFNYGASTTSSPFGGVGQGYGTGNTALGANATTSNAPFAGGSDLLDVALAQAALSSDQTRIVEYVRPLPNAGGNTAFGTQYYETYNGCTITDIRDNEQISVGTTDVVKTVTVEYTYSTRSGVSSSVTNYALSLRNSSLPTTAS